jgi:multidrug efflux pump subunit AcrA (membrane-fusion protein)
MKKRQVIITFLFLLLIPAAIFINKMMKGNGVEQTGGEAAVEETLRKVLVVEVSLEDHQVLQSINGRAVARDRYSIFADVPGRMLTTPKEFREGIYFRKGEVLISLDNAAEKEALKARKILLFNRLAAMLPDMKITLPEENAKWKEYLSLIDPEQRIPELPEFNSEQERLFVSARDILNQFYTIKSEEERLDRFMERAPFSGQLTETSVLPGSYVQPGQRLGELTGTGYFELETSVPISELGALRPGREVKLTEPESARNYNGIVDRIIRAVDERTQTGKVILRITGEGLFHGQFLSGNIISEDLKDCAKLSRSLIQPGNKVFIVEEGRLKLADVEPLAYEAEWVYVHGLEEGSLLLNESSPSFQDGLRVEFDQ